MSWFREYSRSSIGMKQMMAVTGLALAFFVLAHMLGNLQVFGGKSLFNDYAEKLQSLGPLLWIARGGLLFLLVLHVAAGLRLVVLNKAARQSKYVKVHYERSTFYARAMSMTGLILFAFIVYHLLHFTIGITDAAAYDLWENMGDGTERHDAYAMVVMSFKKVPVSAAYLVAVALLSMHLAHGVSSFLQTLGFNHPKYNGFFAKLGPAYGVLLFLGNVSIPIAIMAGAVQ